METPMSSVWLVVLGALLAMITSLIVEIYRRERDTKDRRANLHTILRLELKNFVTLLDKLVESYGSKNYLEIKVINQIENNLKRLESIRDNIVFLKNDTKKEETLTLFNLISVFISDATGIENFTQFKGENDTEDLKKQREEWIKNQRQLIVLRVVDLKNRAQDLVIYFENN